MRKNELYQVKIYEWNTMCGKTNFTCFCRIAWIFKLCLGKVPFWEAFKSCQLNANQAKMWNTSIWGPLNGKALCNIPFNHGTVKFFTYVEYFINVCKCRWTFTVCCRLITSLWQQKLFNQPALTFCERHSCCGVLRVSPLWVYSCLIIAQMCPPIPSHYSLSYAPCFFSDGI